MFKLANLWTWGNFLKIIYPNHVLRYIFIILVFDEKKKAKLRKIRFPHYSCMWYQSIAIKHQTFKLISSVSESTDSVHIEAVLPLANGGRALLCSWGEKDGITLCGAGRVCLFCMLVIYRVIFFEGHKLIAYYFFTN